MAIGVIGQKLGMTRIILADGVTTAVTAIKVDENRIIQEKTLDNDGYNAIQVTTGLKNNKKGEAKIKRVSKAIKGHYAKASEKIGLGLWEFRINESDIDSNSIIDLSLFNEGQFVNVTGKSKGKGFQGGVKRHHFKMQDATHGNSISHRAIGSTGQCQNPGRVFKGKKMAGHMGDAKVTEENLQIIKIDNKLNVMLVAGAVPGAKNGFVSIALSHKKNKENSKVAKDAINKSSKG